MLLRETRVVGKSLPRIDAKEKVTGQAEYTADLYLPGMLFGKVLRSRFAHAKIISIDTSMAEKLPGVMAVVTGRDFPGTKIGFMPKTRDELPMARDKVRYIGEEVAAVAAIQPDIAEEALSLIKVEYEELPAVFEPEKAMEKGAPQIHDHVDRNISCESHFNFGDIEEAFKRSDLVREDEFTTQSVIHGFLEPHACIAKYDANGKITLWASKQSPYIAWRNIARALHMPPSKIRIIQPYVGGGFGGKHEALSMDFAAIMLSKKTGRPVKIVCDQEEIISFGRRRHATRIKIKTGVLSDGTLAASQCLFIADGGAYSSVGPIMLYNCGAFLAMPLKLPNLKYDAYRPYTNKPFAGALRGFGIPLIKFAFETQLDMIAEELNIDPVDIRLKNALHPGDITVNGFKIDSCGLSECITKVAEEIGLKEKRGKKTRNGNKIRGVGMACSAMSSGARQMGHCAHTVIIKMHEDAHVELLTGSVDVGQGSSTVLAQIAAEELGVNFEEVHVPQIDSDYTPLDPGSYGSRVTYISGNAVRAAAAKIREQLIEAAALKLKVDINDLIYGDQKIYVKEFPDKSLSLLDAIRTAYYTMNRPVAAVGSYMPNVDYRNYSTGEGNMSAAYSFMAQAAEVEVDIDTGKIQILKLVVVHDCGRPINPLSVEGQLEGAIMSGAAQVIMENLDFEGGISITNNFMDFGFPTFLDVPQEVNTIHVYTDDKEAPYGAKEAGEGAQISTLPAVANAIYDAVGVRIKELPITPERVLSALKQTKKAIDL